MKYRISKIENGTLRRQLMELGFLAGKELKIKEGQFMMILQTSYNNKFSLSRKTFEEYIEIEEIEE